VSILFFHEGPTLWRITVPRLPDLVQKLQDFAREQKGSETAQITKFLLAKPSVFC
jgi:hypothetical protein